MSTAPNTTGQFPGLAYSLEWTTPRVSILYAVSLRQPRKISGFLQNTKGWLDRGGVSKNNLLWCMGQKVYMPFVCHISWDWDWDHWNQFTKNIWFYCFIEDSLWFFGQYNISFSTEKKKNTPSLKCMFSTLPQIIWAILCFERSSVLE